MIDDCAEIYQSRGIVNSLNMFEAILNKTFDYSGSLGYIIEHHKALADEEFREEEEIVSQGY